MELNNNEWLSHLENCIPDAAKGYNLSMYTIALEAWRRGITVKFFNNTPRQARIKYSLSYKEKTHIFSGSRGDLVSKKAIKICMNKQLTKDYLQKSGVPTPKGIEIFADTSEEEVLRHANSIGYPLVVKPSNGKGGHGVIANIKNDGQLIKALNYVRGELNYSELIIEKHINGVDHRVFVLGNKVIGAFSRIPANVIGDGHNNIKMLLKEKNKKRNLNPSLNGIPIKIDTEMHDILKQQGYTLESIPKKGERVFLKSKNNVSSGGDSTDSTDQLSEEVKKIAIDAVKAIPGLVQGGVDIIVDTENNTGEVLEINSLPSIRNHLFPMEGKARDIPKAIVDFYFPETRVVKNSYKYYFDFDTVIDNFIRRVSNEFLIPPLPKGDINFKQFIVSGKIKNKSTLNNWIKRQTRRFKVDGYLEYLESNKVLIVVAAEQKILDKFEYAVKTRFPNLNIVQKDWIKPIKLGFEIKEKHVEQKDILNTDQYLNLKKELEKVKRELDFYKQKNEKMEKSTSWRITAPIRKVRGMFK